MTNIKYEKCDKFKIATACGTDFYKSGYTFQASGETFFVTKDRNKWELSEYKSGKRFPFKAQKSRLRISNMLAFILESRPEIYLSMMSQMSLAPQLNY